VGLALVGPDREIEGRGVTKKSLFALIAVVLLVVGAGFLRNALDVEWSADSIRDLVDGFGVWAPLVFVILIAFRVLILVPSQLMLPAAGLLFGAKFGAIYGAIGMTLSALMSFALVRVLGADGIRRQFHHRFDTAFTVARSKVGAGALGFATAYPVGPMSAFQFGAAMSGMSFFHYFVAVALGSVVRSATLAYFGSTLLDEGRLYTGAAVLGAVLLIPLLVPRWRAWLLSGLGVGSSETIT
jgi:uncharacterized membrane protein YdjX (TVP38/TMEM64 family)